MPEYKFLDSEEIFDFYTLAMLIAPDADPYDYGDVYDEFEGREINIVNIRDFIRRMNVDVNFIIDEILPGDFKVTIIGQVV